MIDLYKQAEDQKQREQFATHFRAFLFICMKSGIGEKNFHALLREIVDMAEQNAQQRVGGNPQ